MNARNKSYFTNPFVLAALGCAIAIAVGCGGDNANGDNPAPSGGSKNMGGTSSTAGKGGTGNTTAGKGSTPTAGSPVVETGGGGAGSVVENMGGAGGAAETSCTDDKDLGCYSCTPKTTDQYLNHCPSTGCEPFDNSVLTSLTKGKLPDLP